MILELPQLAQIIATEFAALPQVVAIALAGSQTIQADDLSDFDFYIYISADIPVNIRADIAKKFATRAEINNQFWETGDEWIDSNSGCGVDLMYRTPGWIEAQLENVLVKHQAAVGYSTCFWWNVLTSHSLSDRHGWYQQLQQKATQPYPEQLKQAIVAKNYPILRNHISAYTSQVELAVKRNDFISINHRLTAFIASYFDIIFAVNSVAHPGEKRLLEYVQKLCRILPKIETHLHTLLSSPLSSTGTVSNMHQLIDDLDKILISERLMPQSKTD